MFGQRNNQQAHGMDAGQSAQQPADTSGPGRLATNANPASNVHGSSQAGATSLTPTDHDTAAQAIAVTITNGTQSTVADLQALKQQALNTLAALVRHLEQTPEDRFRIAIMMPQSTDN